MSGEALARALAFIMIATAAAPGFSPLLGGLLEQAFGWRSAFIVVAIIAAVVALLYNAALGETHDGVKLPLDPWHIALSYVGLIRDVRFMAPALTVGLIMGGLFAMFSASPAILIEGLGFSPLTLGVFFAGTVFVVFAAGMIAPRLAARLGLRNAILFALVVAFIGGLALLGAQFIDRSLATYLGPDAGLPVRHGHRQSAGHRAGAVAIRRSRRSRVGPSGLPADGGRRHRGQCGGFCGVTGGSGGSALCW